MGYAVALEDHAVFTKPWTLSYRLRRAGVGGRDGCGAAGVQGPYANDAWGCACHDGNANHIEGAEHLGFKWFIQPRRPSGALRETGKVEDYGK